MEEPGLKMKYVRDNQNLSVKWIWESIVRLL